jgi:O-antigen/teichoic acid export membrane protein
MVGVSGCLLQAAVAEPFAHLFFPSRWYPSIVVMQILSLGMATRMIAGGSFALLKSNGRFRMVRNMFWGCALIQLGLLALVLALGGGIIAVSIVVSLVSALTGPAMFYLAIRPFGGRWAEVAAVLLRPVASGVVSVGIAWAIAQGLESSAEGRTLYLMQLVEICVVAVVLNALLARFWMRPVWDDFWVRVRRLMPRRTTA